MASPMGAWKERKWVLRWSPSSRTMHELAGLVGGDQQRGAQPRKSAGKLGVWTARSGWGSGAAVGVSPTRSARSGLASAIMVRRSAESGRIDCQWARQVRIIPGSGWNCLPPRPVLAPGSAAHPAEWIESRTSPRPASILHHGMPGHRSAGPPGDDPSPVPGPRGLGAGGTLARRTGNPQEKSPDTKTGGRK